MDASENSYTITLLSEHTVYYTRVSCINSAGYGTVAIDNDPFALGPVDDHGGELGRPPASKFAFNASMVPEEASMPQRRRPLSPTMVEPSKPLPVAGRLARRDPQESRNASPFPQYKFDFRTL